MTKVWKSRSGEDTPPPGSNLLEKFLSSRGLSKTEAEKFLDPRYEELSDPFLMKDMEKGVTRIISAASAGERITIYADYDADAVTAAAVLLRFFRKCGYQNVDYYIPDRFAEGYGMNEEAARELAGKGTKLIVTVDCGINAVASVEVANQLGIDAVITDHHQVIGPLPPAVAVINPHRPDDSYPCKHLTGVGVAYKLVQALVKKGIMNQKSEIKQGWEKWLLDLVAIGTVADCQSLLDENRIIVKWGLLVLQKTQWIGLRKLMELAGIWGQEMDTYKIGFLIAPRINAAGRIEHGKTALELLLTDDEQEATNLANRLEELNRHRKALTESILSEAREQVVTQKQKILLAAGTNWPKGVVGLVAGRLTEEFARPVLVLDRGSKEATGSARSIGSFNIVEAIAQSREILVKFGGHPAAAGFTLLSEHVEVFHKNLIEYAESALTSDQLTPLIYHDGEVILPEITEAAVDSLKALAPFGQGNPRPVFLIRGLSVLKASAIGQEGKHLRLIVQDGQKKIGCIGFNLGYWAAKVAPTSQIDFLAEPQFNEWNGKKDLQLKLIDLKLHE